MKLQPHQERVVQEKVDLDMKISKLDNFFHGEVYPFVADDEQKRLMRQFGYMKDYSNVLTERIAAFRSQE